VGGENGLYKGSVVLKTVRPAFGQEGREGIILVDYDEDDHGAKERIFFGYVWTCGGFRSDHCGRSNYPIW